jgi:hypothetical protein
MRGAVSLVLCVGFVAIVGTLALPRASAAPGQNDSSGPAVGGTLLPITDDDLFSTADLTALLDPTRTSTQHYGPYASTSPDSGTCGNDWATDTFDRHFTVFFNRDGTVSRIVEQFKDGSFVTPAPLDDPAKTPNGPSPGACQNSVAPAGTVDDGITGKMHGYFIINVAPGTTETSNDPHCNGVGMTNAECDTTTFVDTHFSCQYGTTCTVTTFFFHYAAGDQGLIINEWKNASGDRGGNHGDIRSHNL